MNAFANAIKTQPLSYTENGAATYFDSGNKIVDLFFLCGSLSKAKTERVDFISLYDEAKAEDADRAARIALWLRDVREGAGRRQVFREWLLHIEKTDPELTGKVIKMIPELGRWDDLLVFIRDEKNKSDFEGQVIELIKAGLENPKTAGLASKWMPVKGIDAVRLRRHFGDIDGSPKGWRLYITSKRKVVETLLCSKQYEQIVYEHVPSKAAANYRKAFTKNDGARYAEYVGSLKKDPTKKVNVSAVYPFDVLKGINPYATTDNAFAEEQWKRLPNYCGDSKILPIVDVSGSMEWCYVQGTTRPMDVAVSLGIYLAEKNTGPFQDILMNFSGKSDFINLKGSLANKIKQVKGMWPGGNTNLQAAFEEILKIAKENQVAQADMPDYILVLSDMEFDSCATYGDYGSRVTNYQSAELKFKAAGYEMPAVIFWNINGRQGNSPVQTHTSGTALISGFSPTIMMSVLNPGVKPDPVEIVDKAIMKDRYNYNLLQKAD